MSKKIDIDNETELFSFLEKVGNISPLSIRTYAGPGVVYEKVFEKINGNITFNFREVIRSIFEEKSTLIIGDSDKYNDSIGKVLSTICEFYECHGEKLIKHSKATMYFTPPHSKSFPLHADDHDVFITQNTGRKKWKIYKPSYENTNPVNSLKLKNYDDLNEPYLEIELSKGDVLYIPRGHPHVAETCSESSLHTTFGIYCYTWIDLIESMLMETVDLRGALPSKFISKGKIDSLKLNNSSAESVINLLNNKSDVFIRNVIANKNTTQTSPPYFLFDENYSLENSKLILKKSTNDFYLIKEFPEYCVLIYPKGRFKFLNKERKLIDYILTNNEFSMEILSAIDSKNSRNVITALLMNGFLLEKTKDI